MVISKSSWSKTIKTLSIDLHSQLSLNNQNWHKLKDNPDRRAAELMAGAMVQLTSGGELADVEALLNQSLRWIKREIKAPPCPDH